MAPSSCVSGTTVFACVSSRRSGENGGDEGEALSWIADKRVRGAGSCFCAISGWSLGLMRVGAVVVLGRLADLAVEGNGR